MASREANTAVIAIDEVHNRLQVLFFFGLQLPSPVTCTAVGRLGLYQQLRLKGLSD